MTHVTCKLTAKNRDQLRNPTLGNRVWATFLPFLRERVVKFFFRLLVLLYIVLAVFNAIATMFR